MASRSHLYMIDWVFQLTQSPIDVTTFLADMVKGTAPSFFFFVCVRLQYLRGFRFGRKLWVFSVCLSVIYCTLGLSPHTGLASLPGDFYAVFKFRWVLILILLPELFG